MFLAAFVGLTVSALAAEDATPKKAKLHHVVAFKFKDTATPSQIKEVEEAFRGLKTKIPQVAKLEWGTNVSPEKRDKGFTHAWIVSFKNEKDRDLYLEHPAHKEFGKLVGPVFADVFVIDFWAKK